MNLLKGVVSICHRFRSTGQPGRFNGFERCFQDRYAARRYRVTPVLAPHEGKQKPVKGIIEPLLGIIEPRLGIIEPRLGIIERLLGITKPLLGITKPDEGINKPCLKHFVISSATSEVKTSIIAAKAVVCLYAGICSRTSNVLDIYYLRIILSEPSIDIRTSYVFYNYYLKINFRKSYRAMISIVERLPPSCAKEFRGHYKKVKQVKRRRDREPSRLPKTITRSMKKRKVRYKLKCILRKCTPKSSRLYWLVTHYKLWYVTYLHKCDCFFNNFLRLKRLAASKLLQNNKRITSSCLFYHKTTKPTSSTKRYCFSRLKLLTSGDIELNPGPQQNVNSQTY